MGVARCYAMEGDLAYGPVIEWLRSESIRQRWAALDDVWLSEIARLLPELLSERPALAAPGPLSERWQRQRLFEALARAVLAGGRPLLLFIDDLQWSDRETLDWLHYLLQYAPQSPLLILGTVRLEEVEDEHRYSPFRLVLQRSGHLSEIPLKALSESETTALANEMTGHSLAPDEAERLYRDTEGNPLFVVEMMRAGGEIGGRRSEVRNQRSEVGGQKSEIGGRRSEIRDRRSEVRGQDAVVQNRSLPPKVAAVLQHRISQLSPPTQMLIQLAAVIGREFTFDLLAQTCDQPEDTVVEALDEAWQRRIIREQGVHAYDFSHDKLRTVAYARVSPARRRYLHKRVAMILTMKQAELTDDACIQIAQHYLEAGDQAKAAYYYHRAVDVASRRYAIESLLSASTQALALLQELDPQQIDRASLHTQAAIIDERMWSWEMVGDMDAYLRDLTMLEAIGTALQDEQILNRKSRLHAAALIRLGRYREAEETAMASAAHHRAAGSSEEEGLCFTIIGRAKRELGAYADAVVAFEQALTLLDLVNSFVYQIQAYSYLSTTYWQMSDYEQALLCGQKALVICERESMPERKRFALGDMGAAAAMLGQEAQARQWLTESLELARLVTDIIQEAFCRGHLGWLALCNGDAGGAERELQMAYELSQSADIVNYSSWLLRGLAETAAAQGQPEQARSLAAQALAIAQANHQGREQRSAQLLLQQIAQFPIDRD